MKTKKTHAINGRLTDKIAWTFCGKAVHLGAVAAQEGEQPTCNVCRNNPRYIHLLWVQRWSVEMGRRNAR